MFGSAAIHIPQGGLFTVLPCAMVRWYCKFNAIASFEPSSATIHMTVNNRVHCPLRGGGR